MKPHRRLLIILVCLQLILAFPTIGESNSPDVSKQLQQLNEKATASYHQGKYQQGIEFAREALTLANKRLNRNDYNRLKALNILAVFYTSTGRYKDAELLHEEVLRRGEKVFGPNHNFTLNALINIGSLYERLARYEEAGKYFQKAVQRSEKGNGRSHLVTLKALDRVATLYMSQGRYGEAEEFAIEVLQLRQKVLGHNHDDTIQSQNNLATLYTYQGRYEQAKLQLEDAWRRSVKVKGYEHPITVTIIGNLALVYSKQGSFEEADNLFKKALQLSIKVLGYNHPNTIMVINNLGSRYDLQDRFGEAEQLFEEILRVSNVSNGRNHPDTLMLKNNLATIYMQQGHYKESESLYSDIMIQNDKVLGMWHPTTLSTISNFINLQVVMEHPSIALKYLQKEENRLLSRSFQELYAISNGNVRRQYLDNISTFQDMVFSLALTNDEETYHRYAADVTLRWKQIYLDERIFQQSRLSNKNDDVIDSLRKKIQAARASLGVLTHAKGEKHDEVKVLRHKLELIESDLFKRVSNSKPGLEISNVNLDQIFDNLQDDSGLLEFRVFNLYDFKTFRYVDRHLAGLLAFTGPDSKKRFLFNDIGSFDPIAKLARYKNNDASLYYNLFGSFDKYINTLSSIYIAPDSVLNLISFSALRLFDGRYLTERQKVGRLLTGRDLISRRNTTDGEGIVTLGGIDYGRVSKNKGLKMPSGVGLIANTNQQVSQQITELFPYLPNSLSETTVITDTYLNSIKSGSSMFYYGQDATEYKLKNLRKAPRILHLSTHGFFLSSKSDDGIAKENPLLLSGLAMAHANDGLQGRVDDNGEDGLLFSLEVMGLNLLGTELVSLSACDTGKGVVDYSEGVYGLARAFRVAGAQSILMTLQEVGDQSSREFMQTFYDTWLASPTDISPLEALHRTRLAFINHPTLEYRNPSIWSPYVLVGGEWVRQTENQ